MGLPVGVVPRLLLATRRLNCVGNALLRFVGPAFVVGNPDVARNRWLMSKPLIPNPKRVAEAAAFHRAVFDMWGKSCYLCRRRAPATDAAHVIPRARLGPLRYASPHFARPAHRDCHEAQEAGKIEWPLAILRDAARHYNQISKVPMHVP